MDECKMHNGNKAAKDCLYATALHLHSHPLSIESMKMPFAVQEPDLGVVTLERRGTWYFAFGANMSNNKLTHVRGITPIESAAGSVEGWRLTFTHRCRKLT